MCLANISLGGNQQFTTRKFQFTNVKIAIDLLWDWGWTWKSLSITGADIGIRMINNHAGGSIVVMDSDMTSVKTGISIESPRGTNGLMHLSVHIVNLVLKSVGTAVKDTKTGVTLAGGSYTVDLWTQGKVYDTNYPGGIYVTGGAPKPLPPKSGPLFGGPNNGIFERSKPQYQTLSANDFMNANIVASGTFTLCQ